MLPDEPGFFLQLWLSMRNSIISVILFVSPCFSLSAKIADIELQNNISDRYVVAPGDTLWGIASRFLKDPWLWAQIWGLNREQVKNPHRIYPGDIIVREKTSDGSRLRLASEIAVVKLSP